MRPWAMVALAALLPASWNPWPALIFQLMVMAFAIVMACLNKAFAMDSKPKLLKLGWRMVTRGKWLAMVAISKSTLADRLLARILMPFGSQVKPLSPWLMTHRWWAGAPNA